MTLNVIIAFTIILFVLASGEFISTKTKAFVPSVFVSAVIFLIGFWTILPKDLISQGSFVKPAVYVSMYLLLTHMGTLMSIRELIGQWKTVIIAMCGIAGICFMTLSVGKIFFDWQTVVVATPPLTGGVVASILMSTAASDLGYEQLAVLATCMYIMQGFVGYPITALCLKKEAKRLSIAFANGEVAVSSQMENRDKDVKKKLLPAIPEKYLSPYVILLKLGIVASIAHVLAPYIHLNEFVVCLLFGVMGCEIGFLEEKALVKANAFGWLMTVLMAFIFASLAKATPQMLLAIVGPLLGIIALGIMGMAILSMTVGKLLGYTKEMAFSVALTALFGFPADYILTIEAVKSVCSSKEEEDFILDDMLPKMLVGGFTTVTVASVIIAGIFVKML